jgi:hypothetical protein
LDGDGSVDDESGRCESKCLDICMAEVYNSGKVVSELEGGRSVVHLGTVNREVTRDKLSVADVNGL